MLRRGLVMRWLAPLLLVLSACKGGASPAPEPDSAVPQSSPAVAQEAADEPEAKAPEPTAEPEAPEQPAGLGPLAAEQAELFRAGDEDTLAGPTELHYVKSNERRHDLFFPYIRDKGGAYLGVASDPNYTLIGVAKPEIVFLLDIDRWVVDMHNIYEVLIEASEDPETLHSRFHKSNHDASLAMLEEAFADRSAADKKRLLRSYKATRETIYRHLKNVIRRKQDGVVTTWLSDKDSYDHVRKLFQLDRVRIIPGNLGGKLSMRTIATALEQMKIPLRVLYLSNAEEYFTFRTPYRENIRALPTDDESVVCRTIYTKPEGTGHGRTFDRADMLWNYQIHKFQDYQERLARKHLTRNFMLKLIERAGDLTRKTGTKGLSLIALPVATDD